MENTASLRYVAVQHLMENLDTLLDRWQDARVIDLSTAERIRSYESQREPKRSWGVIVAVVFGCVMVGAGVLLFVAAHWDDLSPTQRFMVVLSKVALFHIAGAFFANRSRYLSMALHMIGTIALGAGIFLAGQIFNLEEHWPGGIMLWAIGAAIGWWLLRDWAQGMLVAILTPFWLIGEWTVRVDDIYNRGFYIAAAFLVGLAFAYLSAMRYGEKDHLRRALAVIGVFGALIFVPVLVFASHEEAIWWGDYNWRQRHLLPLSIRLFGWASALGVPVAVAFYLRGRRAWHNLLAAAWIWGLSQICRIWDPDHYVWFYAWALVGSVGLIYSGVDDRRKERINLGMGAFGVTIIAFYCSDVLDKYGRSTVLIAMGLMFLVGGYFMERWRRSLIAQVSGGSQ